MARRGDRLREHILYAAKDVFLEVGFERASMDMIAGRAETSKRTLYAHFENKERLFLEVIELVRYLFLGKLKTPADYPGVPVEAVTMFCGRFAEVLLYERTIQMCRVLVAEVERFPEGAARLFDVLFAAAQERLSVYLRTTFSLTPAQGEEMARDLLGRVTYPRFPRALFGLEPLHDGLNEDAIRADFDLGPIRQAVVATLPADR